MSAAFARLEEGYENALKDYYKKQIGQLNMLIACLLGSLNKGERQKVNSITIFWNTIFWITILSDPFLASLPPGDDNLHN